MTELHFEHLPPQAPSLRALHESPADRVLQAGALASLLDVIGAVIGDPDTALRLLAEFPTLLDLQRALPAELGRINGLGPKRIAALKAALELGRRLIGHATDDRPQVRSPADAANLLMPEMNTLEQEHLRVMLLDTRMRVMAVPTIYVGNLNSTIVRTAEVFREAIRQNASSIILIHNHPSGELSASPEDLAVSRNIIAAGQLLDIAVVDHLIIAGNGQRSFLSLKESGLVFE
jgi:DNA repair protein RadC